MKLCDTWIGNLKRQPTRQYSCLRIYIRAFSDHRILYVTINYTWIHTHKKNWLISKIPIDSIYALVTHTCTCVACVLRCPIGYCGVHAYPRKIYVINAVHIIETRTQTFQNKHNSILFFKFRLGRIRDESPQNSIWRHRQYQAYFSWYALQPSIP